jgi:hypothetical protein
MPELKTFKRPGVNWYGVSCFANLNTFVSLPSVQDNIADIKSQIQDMNNLMCETVSKMKTSYSDTLTSAGVSETREVVNRLETQMITNQNNQEKEERGLNKILHKLAENNTTEDDVVQMCKEMSLWPGAVTKVKRISRRNVLSPPTENIRPVKISFSSELVAREFVKRFRTLEDKRGVFVTPDLSPEERKAEYTLRLQRNSLKELNPLNSYRIRQGKVFVQEQNSYEWSEVVDLPLIKQSTQNQATNADR